MLPDNNGSLSNIEQAILSIAQAIQGQVRQPTVLSPDVGDFKWRPMDSALSGYLLADGTAYSRTTYADLFAYLCPSKGTFSITIATPGVATLVSHGLQTGDQVYLTTTGALPTGLSANTLYYVIRSTADVFWLATTRANANAGTKIATSGSQSGVHTIRLCPYGLGDGSTTFNVPNIKGCAFVAVDVSQTEFSNAGIQGGEKTHLLTGRESGVQQHLHNISGVNGSSMGNGSTYPGLSDNTNRTTQTQNAGHSDALDAHNNLQPYITAYCFIKT